MMSSSLGWLLRQCAARFVTNTVLHEAGRMLHFVPLVCAADSRFIDPFDAIIRDDPLRLMRTLHTVAAWAYLMPLHLFGQGRA